ncbi:MAG: PadR family transcriptional regulator [Chromatiales bacterium]|jgi:DNA-binding PadR family transcriptional regulator|nr:PadR family transcriptional regulator [Chromatiales bacterium]MDX9766179.1 PadR family transcriptional regulator [Ectothiorhodospiraceae bacterium]
MDTKTLCLGTLCFGDASGYDIKKMFEVAYSHFQGAGFGSIYPALAALEREGLVGRREEKQDKRPDRKVFSITEAGRERLLATLNQSPPLEKYRSDFLVIMFFAHLLDTERLREVLEQHRQDVQTDLNELQSIRDNCTLSEGMRFTVECGIACMEARLKVLRDRGETLLTHHSTLPEPPT